ncbi:MAG: RNA methyltransferase [Alphaproteobacteria bacterium]|nr:RNA methyltransferase [Alphaproteobacteria bacterium]
MADAPPADAKRDIAAEAVIERYGELSGDKDAFEVSLTTPLPICLWANRLRIDADDLANRLKSEGFMPDPVAWNEGAFRLPATDRPGRNWLYKAGLCHIQEEAALLPVMLLEPQPGERILDLCAAPGNKTAQIAIALDNQGTVIANDSHAGRLAPLHAAIARLGLVNITTTAMDGIEFPLDIGPFDRVLADVPCSGEGTIRKGPRMHQPVPDNFRDWLRGTQRSLLRRAINLCRPGGRIVYSTCTFSPEENEAIIDAILSESSDIRLLPAAEEIPGASPGITEWQGKRFSKDLTKTLRVWPHKSGTGGFFAAIIEKIGGSESSPTPITEMDPAAQAVLDGFIEHFGLPQNTFDGLRTIRAGRRLKLTSDHHDIPDLSERQATGLTLTNDTAKVPKLSTEVAMAYGGLATRNVVDVDDDTRAAFMTQQTLTLSANQTANCSDKGYVIVRSEGIPLGVGMLRRDGIEAMLESQFPKNWA